MGTKRELSVNETKDEKKSRKRQKKEAKKRKEALVKSSTTAGSPVPTSDQTERAEKESILSSKKLRLVASILPSGLSHVKASVEQCLQEFMLKYSDKLEGVMMAYKNVQVLRNGNGMIVEELPHIHYDVTCDALVFTPLPNQRLKGTVTESFHSHISMVVFNFFNASISASHLRQAGFEYDETKAMWYESQSEFVIEKLSTVSFEIEKVHESSKFREGVVDSIESLLLQLVPQLFSLFRGF